MKTVVSVFTRIINPWSKHKITKLVKNKEYGSIFHYWQRKRCVRAQQAEGRWAGFSSMIYRMNFLIWSSTSIIKWVMVSSYDLLQQHDNLMAWKTNSLIYITIFSNETKLQLSVPIIDSWQSKNFKNFVKHVFLWTGSQ